MSGATLRELEADVEDRAAEHAVPCPACGGERFDILLSPEEVRAEQEWLDAFHAARIERPAGDDEGAKDRASFTQSDATNVVACRACGTVLRDPQPTCRALALTYALDHYGEDALARLAANQEQFFRAKLTQLAEHAIGCALPGDGARVLEVGSFVGGFLVAARERGWRALGVDVGVETVEFMRRKGLDVVRGDVLDADFSTAAFEAVFVWNTFDQLCNPADVLARIAELVGPGGLLVVRVPNGRFEAACVALRRSAVRERRRERILRAQAYNNFLTFPYLTGYTPESLGALLARHGFRVGRVYGDTILSLAGPDTKPFAVHEEERTKRAVLRLCERIRCSGGAVVHPWIDVVGRRVDSPAA
ncbi:MAG TPA: methyltransferase domain-containing protein [Candidatus Binatia bacterium]|nr:methyltransferase domain-containing protein [Candidatus Binatia bacterium]